MVVFYGRRLQELHRLALEEDLGYRVSKAYGAMRRMAEGWLGPYHGGWGQDCRAAGRPKIICKAEIQPSGPEGSSDQDGIGVADVVLRCCCAGLDAIVSERQKVETWSRPGRGCRRGGAETARDWGVQSPGGP